MGMDHGAFALVAVGSEALLFWWIMNLWWIGGLALYVLAENVCWQ